jgi:hypothetical protein
MINKDRFVALKDGPSLVFKFGNMVIHACDVDGEGFVENVDVIIDGSFRFCFNIQTPMTEKEEILSQIIYELLKPQSL